MPPNQLKIIIIGNGKFYKSIIKTNYFNVIRCFSKTEILNLENIDFDVIWILTQDRLIEDISYNLSTLNVSFKNKTVIHSSGFTSINVLKILHDKGALTISLHPNLSLTGELPIPSDIVWSYTSDNKEEAFNVVSKLLNQLKPILMFLDDNSKILYHTAATFASNFSLTFFNISKKLFIKAGINETLAKKIVASYMYASINNSLITDLFPLTGPITRDDTNVIENQIAVVMKNFPEYSNLFNELLTITKNIYYKENNI
ncbi:MAG: DUF2520 domain-containing protein [Chlorobiota bacterium]|nr:MAG: DUF2520 domain-containing protein [Chlorobiota bacterium]